MPNPFSKKAKKTNPFSKKARERRTVVSTEATQETQKQKLSPFTRKARKQIKAVEGPQTRGFRHPGSEKADYTLNGLRYTNPRDHGDHWSVDVVNGDESFTFHNKYGAWFMDLSDNRMREPLTEIARELQRRYIEELKRIGAELPFVYRTQQEKKQDKKPVKPAATKGTKDNEKPKRRAVKSLSPNIKQPTSIKKSPWKKAAK